MAYSLDMGATKISISMPIDEYLWKVLKELYKFSRFKCTDLLKGVRKDICRGQQPQEACPDS